MVGAPVAQLVAAAVLTVASVVPSVEGQTAPASTQQRYTIRIQGIATDGVAPPPPTPTAVPVPTEDAPVYVAQPTATPIPWPTATPVPVRESYGSCPALIAQSLGRAGCMISYCESRWDSGATGAAGERGWYQIHPIHHDSTYDPWGNVQAAIRISSGGTDWSAWSVRSVLYTGVCPNGEAYGG